MAPTALLIEILLAGTLGSCWVILLVRLFEPEAVTRLWTLLSQAGQLGTLIATIGVLIIYLVGWISHFLGEILLDRFFQSRHRDRLFADSRVPFYEVRTLVFERASDATIADIQFDRQVLRITRAAALNFMIIGLLIPGQAGVDLWRGVALTSLSFGLAGLALSYWRVRYRSTFKKFLDVYNVLAKASYSSMDLN